ncbi:hypothetical protein LTR12_015727 [Friedmanniomyces endolithicus]|nr:hypothetical protein LTR12_015727 [Friedmanniomyces endolithicus]
MASGQNDTDLRTRPLQHAGVNRTHARERLPPRKSARLAEVHRKDSAQVGGRGNTKRYNSNGGAYIGEKCTQQQQKSVSRKQPKTHHDRASPEEPYDEPRKRAAKTCRRVYIGAILTGNLSVDQQHPIAYWAANKWWPRQSRKTSDTDSAKPGSTNQGKQKSREQKSAEYKKPQYATVLATKGVFMKLSSLGVTKASQDWCKKLLEQQQTYPQDTLFRDDLFKYTRESVQDKNET